MVEVRINGKYFDAEEKKSGSIVSPKDKEIFDFSSWAETPGGNLGDYKKKHNAVIVEGVIIDKSWYPTTSRSDRTPNTSPHIDFVEKPSNIVLAHKLGTKPRETDSCISKLSKLSGATRKKILDVSKKANGDFSHLLRYMLEADSLERVHVLGWGSYSTVIYVPGDKYITKRIIHSSNQVREYVLDVQQWLEFCTGVFDLAEEDTFRFSPIHHPGSAVIIDDGAFAENREPIVHWQENPPDITTLNTFLQGEPLYKKVFSTELF